MDIRPLELVDGSVLATTYAVECAATRHARPDWVPLGEAARIGTRTPETPPVALHEEYPDLEWIHVLSGRMRFVLGDQDLVLGPGEVAAFDTTVPHWFGSTGDEPSEILSILGRPGERMTVRTTPPQS